MSEPNKSLPILDTIAVVSFLIGLANYGENVDQTTMNSTVQKAVANIHEHLIIQDEKLDKILDLLEESQNENHKTHK